jgi:hypothetical protein
MPRLTPEQQKDEIRFIRGVEGWPHWPTLPVKQYQPNGGWPKVGILFDRSAGSIEPVIVYEHNIYAAKAFDENKVLARYDTIEAMVADNWVVD